MFDAQITSILIQLASNRASINYAQRQAELARNLPCTYEQLVDVAYDYKVPEVRIEALEIVGIMALPGFKTVLSDSAKADPVDSVHKHAEALLFRALVEDRRRGVKADPK